MFVFGSEEYPEWVNTSFNDVFGAYLNGTQVAFDSNGHPITINGPFFNSSNVVYDAQNGTEYDGSTPILKTKAQLTGGSTGNTLTFIVCDAGDHIYDSGVFIAGLTGCVGNDCSGTEPCAFQDDDDDGVNACDDCDDTDPNVFPDADEECNGVDDNCNGEIDENMPVTSCGLGPCYHEMGICQDGQIVQCDPYEGAEVEECDGIDNDCDGSVDEGFDSDGDGVVDCMDGCPNDPQKTDPGVCGCGLSDACQSGGNCLAEGQNACANGPSAVTCVGGQLLVEQCGQDFCNDSGNAYGGGTCSAVDYYCEGGVCKSTASSGTDNCGVEQAVAADLSTWKVESTGSASWNVSADKQSVKQTVNGYSTFFYSDFNAFGSTITGKISVANDGDDDFIGFALGFDPGDTTNANADYLLVDWKKGDQYHSPWGGWAYKGLAVSRITGPANSTDLWSHTGKAQELARGINYGNVGWQYNTQYVFRIEFSETALRVWVNDQLEIDETGNFSNGRFAFYNLSQSQVSYSGLASIPVLEDDNPKVHYYSCQGGNSCVEEVTEVSDSCADGGTDMGGGSCQAVDWACVDGALEATSSGGDDVCGGTAQAPNLTYYSCVASNGVVADTCAAGFSSGADSCNDTGTGLGGGSCAAVDFACSNGLLSSNATSGDDTCGGTAEAPVLTWYQCAGGNTCVEDTVGGSDSCNDTGDEFGGGACNAVDWICEDGVITNVATSGEDTCSGSADAPEVSYYSCVNGNSCVADTMLAQDSCADDGSALGGGSCTATNWVCDGTNTFFVEQGDLKVPLQALHGNKTVAEFYSYGYPMGASSNAGEETSQRGNIYLYYDDVNDLFSLVVVLDKFNDGSGGQVKMTIDGLAGSGAVIAVKDDPGDYYNLSTGQFSWKWLACCTDGMALQLAGDSACLTFNPTYVSGINEWAVVSHNPDGTRTETILPGSTTTPFTVCTTSSLHKTVTNGTDTCGGTDANPAVEYFTCQASDGTVADRCVASTTAQADTCADSGDASGGGSCAATDWYCADGLLGSNDSTGTDTCGGTAADPTVTWYACANNNSCIADTTQQSDSCTDSGSTNGGGECGAVDWSCSAGKLAMTETSGVDTCGGDDDDPSVTWYQCLDNRKCVSAVKTQHDSCVDTGDELGGGTCKSFNAKCENGKLTGSGADMVDYCVSSEPWVAAHKCITKDGVKADYCGYDITKKEDSCIDSGNEFGGGSCAATDWTCSAGQLASASSSGTDVCFNSADAPSVSYYSCSGGNACVAASTAKADSCADSGGEYGGGSCAATNWYCNGSTLSSASTSGTDTCAGTPEAPAVEYWVCINGDGIESDVCEPRLTEEADSCADTGDEYGAGWCTANDWTCADGALTVAESEGLDTCGGTADAPNISYFVCQNNNACIAAQTEQFDTCSDDGDSYGGGGCSATDWDCGDVFIGDLLAVNFSFETGDFSGWEKGGDAYRAAVVGGHTGVSGTPYSAQDGSKFLRLTAGCPGNPTEVWQELYMGQGQVINGWAAFDAGDYVPYYDSAVVIFKANGQQVAQPFYADVGTVGSYGDGPWVQWEFTAPEAANYLILYSVVNMYDCLYTSYGLFDGPEYTCVDADGDGQCDSPSYAGYLGSEGTAGTDTCGGNDDAPSVTWYACNAGDGDVADACVADSTQEYDLCTDDGGELGGGGCSAVDWDCAGGVLASTDNAGNDTCGGTEDAPSVEYWACNASDGKVGDLCVAQVTQKFDLCTDSGNGYGGGSCSAIDWDCSLGELSSTSNAGEDTCGGDEDAPNVEFWVCSAGDGEVADICTAAVTEEYDLCTDDGGAYGGGSCSAIDWDCSAGVLASTSNAGVDVCGGSEDVPNVTFWACNASDGAAADLCVSAVTGESDKCTEDGGAYGGGTCSAIDWDCSNGLLASTSNAGVDTCGGTVDVPNVEYWNCTAGDGAVADICTAAVTEEYDLCQDSGDAYGGGGCTAIDWDCEAGVLASTANAGDDTCGGDEDAPNVEFWVCSAGDGIVADICTSGLTEESDQCSDSGDNYGSGSCSAIDWDCSLGVLASTSNSGEDTCGGTEDAPNVTWWACNASDGAMADLCVSAVTGEQDTCLDTGSELGGGGCSASDWDCADGTLAKFDTAGTDTCGGDADAPNVTYFTCQRDDGTVADSCVASLTEKSDLCVDNGTAYGGGSCTADDWTCGNGLLALAESEGTDTCGGDDDAPDVTYYVCQANDGAANDKCVAALTEEFDDCSDTGDMWGGGSCSANDWDCSGGVLALDATSGADVCGGDVDAPNVTFWSCGASDGGVVDRCLDEVTQRADICVDTGTPSGSGTCEATDWVCENAVLSSTSNDGIDTCGDGSDSQLYYYVCDAADGAVDDLCIQIWDETPPDAAVVLAEQAVLDDGEVVYQVYCDVSDICDNNVESSLLAETPSPEGLDQRLKTHGNTSIKFNLNNSKLDIFAPVPDAILADLYELGGIPLEEGQSVTIKTHAGETYHYMYKVQDGIALLELKGPWVRFWCSAIDDAGLESQAYWEEVYHKEQDCGCQCQCDCPADGECACECICENAACNCECSGEGDCACNNPNLPEDPPEDPEDPPCSDPDCNQGVGNGDEGCDPGNSNQGDPDNSNDENGGTPGDPGKNDNKGGKKK